MPLRNGPRHCGQSLPNAALTMANAEKEKTAAKAIKGLRFSFMINPIGTLRYQHQAGFTCGEFFINCCLASASAV
jgi:hypothetical protein